jgi:hypothetical protein
MLLQRKTFFLNSSNDMYVKVYSCRYEKISLKISRTSQLVYIFSISDPAQLP